VNRNGDGSEIMPGGMLGKLKSLDEMLNTLQKKLASMQKENEDQVEEKEMKKNMGKI